MNSNDEKRQFYSQIPLHVRISNAIEGQILKGILDPGQKLPNEDQLAANFNVSRITLRSALATLVKKGLVTRRRAKGTFVSEKPPIAKQDIISGTIFDIISSAEKFQVKCLGIEVLKVSDTLEVKGIQSFFGLSKNDEIGLIRRVRLLDGIPIYYLENYLPFDIVNKISVGDLSEKPLLTNLKEKIGLKLGKGKMFLEAIPADVDVSKVLETEIMVPLFFAQAFWRFPSGDPFEIVNLFMKPEYFKYQVDIAPEGHNDI